MNRVCIDVFFFFLIFCFFFFQAEDGIRDYKVTGVQTCALPIWESTVILPKNEITMTQFRKCPNAVT